MPAACRCSASELSCYLPRVKWTAWWEGSWRALRRSWGLQAGGGRRTRLPATRPNASALLLAAQRQRISQPAPSTGPCRDSPEQLELPQWVGTRCMLARDCLQAGDAADTHPGARFADRAVAPARKLGARRSSDWLREPKHSRSSR